MIEFGEKYTAAWNSKDPEQMAAFYEKLTTHMATVHDHFRHLFASDEGEKQDSKTDDLKYLWQNINDPQCSGAGSRIEGFRDAASIVAMLRTLEDHTNTKRLTTNGRKRLDRLIPILVSKVVEYDAPEIVLQRLVDLIITIERRTCYISLLIEEEHKKVTGLASHEDQSYCHSLRHSGDIGELFGHKAAIRCHWCAACGSVIKIGFQPGGMLAR